MTHFSFTKHNNFQDANLLNSIYNICKIVDSYTTGDGMKILHTLKYS